MIVIRFKLTCRPESRDEARAALHAVVEPSRQLEGVVHFDIAQDIVDPDSFIATEVFEDRAALDRQEALAQVQRVIALLPRIVAAEPEATIYNVSSSEPWG